MPQPYYDKPTLVDANLVDFNVKNQVIDLLVSVNGLDGNWHSTYKKAIFPESADITKAALFDLLAKEYSASYRHPPENYFVELLNGPNTVPITTDVPIINANSGRIRFAPDLTQPCFKPAAPSVSAQGPVRGPA